MWYTVALGALVNMIFLWLFDPRVSTHLLLGGLQYFGIIYGLLLGLLAVGAYQNHADAERAVVTEPRRLLPSIGPFRVSRAIPHRSQDARARVRTFDHRGRVATAASRHSPSP
jgi:hypothetical protein